MNNNTPKAKGIRTAYQAIAGAVVAYIAGLVALPAVQEYTSNFIQTEGVAALLVVLGTLGVSSGILAWLQNRLENRL